MDTEEHLIHHRSNLRCHLIWAVFFLGRTPHCGALIATEKPVAGAAKSQEQRFCHAQQGWRGYAGAKHSPTQPLIGALIERVQSTAVTEEVVLQGQPHNHNAAGLTEAGVT